MQFTYGNLSTDFRLYPYCAQKVVKFNFIIVLTLFVNGRLTREKHQTNIIINLGKKLCEFV